MEVKKSTTSKKPKKNTENVGRPTVMTEEVLASLKFAFSIGATDREACEHAGIDCATLYRYQEANPEYCNQKEGWKESPIFKSRQILINQIVDGKDGELALKYLERKRKDEFAPKSTVDLGVSQELAESIARVKNMFENAKIKK